MNAPQQVSAPPSVQLVENQPSVRDLTVGRTRGVHASSAIKFHWHEYAIEAALLGAFMISACMVTALLELPGSPVQAPASALLRRALIGAAMGLTAIALIYSPWGQRSGAHFNPSVTLTFLRLGKIKRVDAVFYMLAQFIGAVAGVALSASALGRGITDPHVQYAATYPGKIGPIAAALGEFIISFLQMTIVLIVSNHRRYARLTGIAAGLMVAVYITVEAPFSGMSMNPARTFGSALPAGIWNGFLIYLLVPPIAMLLAAQNFLWIKGRTAVHCCKLDHSPRRDCIFCGMKGTRNG